jgi:hypothetical protein
MSETERLRVALEESVKLQSHYASLLNQYDGGQRMTFASADEWLARVAEVLSGTVGGRTRTAAPVNLATPTEKVIIVAGTHAQAMQLAYELGYRTQWQQFRYVIYASEPYRIYGLDHSIPYYVTGTATERKDYHELIQLLATRGHKRLSLP